MEPLKQNSFEQEWQRAFENASISPPSDMWDKIEEELERKKRRPFLFILRPSAIASGVAAALVLVLGGLFFLNKNSVKNQKELSQNTPKTQQSVAATSTNPVVDEPTTNSPEHILNDQTLASARNPIQSSDNYSTKNRSQIAIFSNKIKSQKANTLAEPMLIVMAKPDAQEEETVILENKEFIVQNIDNKGVANKEQGVLADTFRNDFANLSTLKSKKYTYFGSSLTLNRNKLFFDNEVSEAPIIASNESKFWLGIQSGVSPFDPNMKLGGLNTYALQAADAFAKVSNSQSSPNIGTMGPPLPSDKFPAGSVTVSQPQNAIKSGVGVNTGFAFGYKIAKKWNLESGIRYLRGNSTLQSNTYTFQQNGYVNTFLADYLLQNSSNNMVVAIQNPINTVVADASQFNNRYEYLMIPMQLGYEIGLTKKLGLNILAGISTDIFLQNTIANDNTFVQEKSTINSDSNIYKPLNISGLGGIRASYLLSKHWQANIGSSYQHSLFSGINSSTALQMRLRMFGVNYGLNYRF